MPPPLMIYGVAIAAEHLAALFAAGSLTVYTATPAGKRQVGEAIKATGRAIDQAMAGRPTQALQSCPLAKPQVGAMAQSKVNENAGSKSDDPCKPHRERYEKERKALDEMQEEHAVWAKNKANFDKHLTDGIEGHGGDQANVRDAANAKERLDELSKRIHAERDRLRPYEDRLFKCEEDMRRKADEDKARRKAEEARKQAAESAARASKQKMDQAKEQVEKYIEAMGRSRQDPNGPGRLYPNPKNPSEYVSREQILKYFLSNP